MTGSLQAFPVGSDSNLGREQLDLMMTLLLWRSCIWLEDGCECVGRSIAELVLPGTLVDWNTVFIFTVKERCSVGSFPCVPCWAPVTLEAERRDLVTSCLVYSLVISSHLWLPRLLQPKKSYILISQICQVKLFVLFALCSCLPLLNYLKVHWKHCLPHSYMP